MMGWAEITEDGLGRDRWVGQRSMRMGWAEINEDGLGRDR